MVINEAMACGLPVLGSVYSQAVEELVTNDVNGWTFAPDRPEEVDAAIARAMMASDDELLAMGHNAAAGRASRNSRGQRGEYVSSG